MLQKAVAKFSASPFRFSGKLCMAGRAFEQVLLCVQHDPSVLDGYIVGADAQAVGVENGAAGAGDGTAAEGRALVGAEAADDVVFAVDVEDTD